MIVIVETERSRNKVGGSKAIGLRLAEDHDTYPYN
jgi:hypothetical protein